MSTIPAGLTKLTLVDVAHMLDEIVGFGEPKETRTLIQRMIALREAGEDATDVSRRLNRTIEPVQQKPHAPAPALQVARDEDRFKRIDAAFARLVAETREGLGGLAARIKKLEDMPDKPRRSTFAHAPSGKLLVPCCADGSFGDGHHCHVTHPDPAPHIARVRVPPANVKMRTSPNPCKLCGETWSEPSQRGRMSDRCTNCRLGRTPTPNEESP